MMFLAGPPVLLITPRAYVVRSQLANLVLRMTGSFLIDFRTTANRNAFQARFERWTNAMGWAFAAIVALGLVAAVLVYYQVHLAGGRPVAGSDLSTSDMLMLAAVMLVAGGSAGYFLGRFCGNGLLPWHLSRTGIRLRRPARGRDADALFDDLGDTYRFAFRVCMLLSAWFGGWIFLSAAPWPGADAFSAWRDWAEPFLALWLLTLLIFFLGVAVPVWVWHRQIERLRAASPVAPDTARTGENQTRHALPQRSGEERGLPGPWLGGGLLSGTALAGAAALNLFGIALAFAVLHQA